MITASEGPATRSDAERLLGIYLDDHRAGAGAGSALADRLATAGGGTEWGQRLRALADEIHADEQTLLAVREALGIGGGGLKRTLARIAERLGRLTPNGRIIRRSPLSTLVECEVLMAGVAGKQRLWAALRVGLGDDPRLAAVELTDAERRADLQLETLREFHEHVAAAVLTPPAAQS